MKTMTCKELGGTCDQKLSANSWDEMVQKMTKHVNRKFGHDLVIVEFFLALNTIVEVHDVFHD